jgi:cytoskeletal protein RodZ
LTIKHNPKSKALSTLLIVGIVVVIAVVIGVAAYVLMAQNPAPSTSPEPTTTPTQTPTPTQTEQTTTSPTVAPTTSTASPTPAPTQTATPTSAPGVSGANSLQYTVSATSNGVPQGSYIYSAKNIGTSDLMLRIEFTDTDGSKTIYIINGKDQKAYAFSDNQWTDLSVAYQTQYATWSQLWQGYFNALTGWSGVGSYTYTSGTDSVTISNISVNPSLPDSLFTEG